MNKIDLSLFETKGDLMEYFDKNFANSIKFNRYFFDYYNNDENYWGINTLISLLRRNELEILEYDYIYNNSLHNESKFLNPLWEKVKYRFTRKGIYITPLRMNVIHFITASENVFNINKFKVEIVDRNSLLFEDFHTLIIMGILNFNELISLMLKYYNQVNYFLFFPYPKDNSNMNLEILNLQHFYSITLTHEGLEKCRNVIKDRIKEAGEIMDKLFNSNS